MPAYNCESTILRAVNSVENQIYKSWELIICDDLSTDSTRSILKNLNISKKIKIFYNNKNLGAGLTRNICIKESIGEYIAFLDADDFWDKRKLQEQINFMINNDFNFTCTSQYEVFKSHMKVRECRSITNSSNIIYENTISLSTVIILKKLLIPFKKMRREDHFLWYEILNQNKIDCVGLFKPLTYFDCTNNSLSKNKLKLIKHTKVLLKDYFKFNHIKTYFYLILITLNKLKRIFFSKRIKIKKKS